jgi:hypothetical protein
MEICKNIINPVSFLVCFFPVTMEMLIDCKVYKKYLNRFDYISLRHSIAVNYYYRSSFKINILVLQIKVNE